MENVKVSIIVPSYKRKRELYARAIESLLAQSYENIEIIVVDDNAKPELAEYRQDLQSYIKELDNDKIIYIQNEVNLGSAKSRNAGISKASGEYITFLDDDDRYLPSKVKNQIEFMLVNDLDMSFTNQILANENGKIVDFREYRRIKKSDNKSLLQYHLTKKITGTNTFMVKKEVLDSIGGFGEIDMGDEFYLMYNIINSDCKIGYCDSSEIIALRAGQEGLTLNSNRLEHEKQVFELMKSNFDKLTFSQRCYCRFRYNVTKLVTYKRAKKYGKMLGCMIMAFFCHPVAFFVEPIRMKMNLRGFNG